MAKSQPEPEKQMPVEPISPQPEPTVTAVGGAEVEYTDIPMHIYQDAWEEHRQFCLVEMISKSRTPEPKPEPQRPPIPPQLAEQTRLEIEAGRKRNAEFAATEAERKRITEVHKNDKWQDKPPEQIFRPGNHVPNPGRAVNPRSIQQAL